MTTCLSDDKSYYAVRVEHPHAKILNAHEVSLPDGAEYSLILTNRCNRDAQANVIINGKEIAAVMVGAKGNFVINCEIGKGRQLTFRKVDSQESKAAGVNPNNPHNGKVEVTFKCGRALIAKRQHQPTSFRDFSFGSSSNYTYGMGPTPTKPENDYNLSALFESMQEHASTSIMLNAGTNPRGLQPVFPKHDVGGWNKELSSSNCYEEPKLKAGTTTFGRCVKEPSYGQVAAISDPDPEYSKTIAFTLVVAPDEPIDEYMGF